MGNSKQEPSLSRVWYLPELMQSPQFRSGKFIPVPSPINIGQIISFIRCIAEKHGSCIHQNKQLVQDDEYNYHKFLAGVFHRGN